MKKLEQTGSLEKRTSKKGLGLLVRSLIVIGVILSFWGAVEVKFKEMPGKDIIIAAKNRIIKSLREELALAKQMLRPEEQEAIEPPTEKPKKKHKKHVPVIIDSVQIYFDQKKKLEKDTVITIEQSEVNNLDGFRFLDTAGHGISAKPIKERMRP